MKFHLDKKKTRCNSEIQENEYCLLELVESCEQLW